MSLDLKISIAYFKSCGEVKRDQKCMICYQEGPLECVSHSVLVANKVHHVACLECLKTWALQCEKQRITPHCPLCRDVLSDKTLVNLCAIFSEDSLKERGDLWQRRFVELVKIIVTAKTETFDEAAWDTQASFLEEDLKYFLLALRFNFIKQLQNPGCVEHFFNSSENFYQGIMVVKSLNIVNMMVWYAVFFSESSDPPLAQPQTIEHLNRFVDRLGEKVKTCQFDMLCDYSQFSKEQLDAKTLSMITSSIASSSCFGLLSYLEHLSLEDQQGQPSSFFSLTKMGVSIVSAALAYFCVRKQTEHATVDRLLNRVKCLAFA